MRFRTLLAVVVTLVVILAATLFGVGYAATRYHAQPMRPGNSVGDATCISCHQEQAAFEHTAHKLTSTLPNRATIQGSFARGQNIVRTTNPQLYFRMDTAHGAFYQTAVLGRAPDTTVRTERIAIVTGVRKGQSYLYWRGDQLYQLPVSYWRMIGWANSPAYPDGRPNFDRAIPPRCLECHASSATQVVDARFVNRFRPDSVILGVSCETCHAAGAEHVRWEKLPLHKYLPHMIVNPVRLARTRQVDGCALCHGGIAPLETAPFTYVPGTALHKRFDMGAAPDTVIDVHGNQVALLERSRCFRESEMSCATCHDVHREQRDPVALSGRCASCHTTQSCGLYPTYGAALEGRCVSCHMPNLPSQTVVSDHEGRRYQEMVRTHWIKVYPQLATLDSAAAH